MKIKQFIEILLKIAGIIILINSASEIGNVIFITYMTFSGEFAFDYSILSLVPSLTYFIALFFLIIKTELVVKLIYNKTEVDDREISLKIHRSELIFFAIVVASLLGIITKLPKLMVNIFININFRSPYGILGEYLDKNGKYVINTGIEIIVLVVLILNAQRITNRVELYRRKKMKNRITETKEIE